MKLSAFSLIVGHGMHAPELRYQYFQHCEQWTPSWPYLHVELGPPRQNSGVSHSQIRMPPKLGLSNDAALQISPSGTLAATWASLSRVEGQRTSS